MATNIKLKGLQEDIVRRVEKLGLVESRKEGVNLAIIKMGLDLGIVDQKELVKKIRQDLKRDGKSADEIIRSIKKVKE